MKKIGILGGMGPEASVDYYKSIVAHFQQRSQSLSVPEIVLYSVDISELFRMVSLQQWDILTEWLLEKLKLLKRAGADFAAISANTPHIVFDRVQPRSPLPLISIVETTVRHTLAQSFRKPLLLGTRLTMQSSFFSDRFAEEGVSIFVPNDREQDYIQEKLENEIERGIFKTETRSGLIAILERTRQQQGIDSAILGCTELPLILQQAHSSLPLINTSAIHVQAICEHCLPES